MSKELAVTISPAGNVTIEALGFQGVGCAEASAELELVLGGGTAKKTAKPEMFAPAISTQGGITQTF